MAKVFAGFTPDQMGKIVPEMQGMQADEQKKFLAANPAAAARVGKMFETAQKRVQMAHGGYMKKGYDEGGLEDDNKQEETTIDTNAQQQQAVTDAAGAAVAGLTNKLISSPESMATKADVATISEADKAAGKVAEGTGLTEEQDAAQQVTAKAQKDIKAAEKPIVEKYDPLQASASVEEVMQRLEAATGKPRDEALVDAQTMDPQTLSQLGLSAAQIHQAQQVQQVPDREVQAGEMISGSAVDMDRVRTETNFAAATGSPSTDATVQGQLTGLMADFEGKQPPAWAAGAMRAATAQMAARGLSGSSMAGQAIIQAAMESALPIAQADASAFQRFELQNLSNKQQAAMFSAEQRAKFLNLEFNQDFQARVANAAKISDIANMNFTADQQVALENARMAQSVDLANLNAQNAKIMADAAAMSQMDMANLNNRQQAAVQNAKSFLQMDMQNLSNEQQTAMFKAQQQANALLTDAAAENAASQFNASSENQTNQFFADLNTRIQTFNTDQQNQMQRFNAGEANALAQFNTTQANLREQFNATNRLVIAQANAAWAQKVTTTENAAQNEANRQFAQSANQMTALGYNAVIQQYRDRMSYAWQTANNDADRATSIATSKIAADATKYASDAAAAAKANEAAASRSNTFWSTVGTVVGLAWD